MTIQLCGSGEVSCRIYNYNFCGGLRGREGGWEGGRGWGVGGLARGEGAYLTLNIAFEGDRA